MCSDRYADDMPFLLPNTQLPPTRSLFSKTSTARPRAASSLATGSPLEPAPTTQVRGQGGHVRDATAPACQDPAHGSETAEVRAAGCVVYRRAADGLELALVHRPRYDDWELSQGQAGKRRRDRRRDAARREVLEETGLARRARPPAGGEARYRDRARNCSKIVRYWLMTADPDDPGPGFTPNHEVDELVWELPPAALARLSYPTDREMVERASGARVNRPPVPWDADGWARLTGRPGTQMVDAAIDAIDAACVGPHCQPGRRFAAARADRRLVDDTRASAAALLGGDPAACVVRPEHDRR